jgi:hypothetical protein
VRPRDRDEATRLEDALSDYERESGALPGLATADTRIALIEQMVESQRRIEFIRRLHERDISRARVNPRSELFDPLKGAVVRQKAGDLEDAAWLVFLFVHYGKNRRQPWAYAQMTYAGQSEEAPWDWPHVAADIDGFGRWIHEAAPRIRATGGGFGNHRKYEHLEETGRVVSSYYAWTNGGSQIERLRRGVDGVGGDAKAAFADLYGSLRAVNRFGRMARLDYLSTIGRLGLVDLSPDRAYVEEATGPAKGAALLWRGDAGLTERPRELDSKVSELGLALALGPDVLEDAICNWQKSPGHFRPFRA